MLTRADSAARLFPSGDLQFSSLDEYGYDEALVHPGLAAMATPRARPTKIVDRD